MSKEEIMLKILTATPETIGRVADILDGRPTETNNSDRRLLTLTEAAHELNLSRMTIHRMCADGRLSTIQTRAGRRRIASAALTAFLKGEEVRLCPCKTCPLWGYRMGHRPSQADIQAITAELEKQHVATGKAVK